MKAKYPQAQVIVAEPAGYDDHALSLKVGHREAHPVAARTICDALMAMMPGELTFAINSKLLANGVSATDEEVGAAVAFAYRELKLVVEPGGAIGLAALLAGRIDARGKNVVIVLSGGNVDADLFAKLVAFVARPGANSIKRRTRVSRPGSCGGSAPADRWLLRSASSAGRSQ